MEKSIAILSNIAKTLLENEEVQKRLESFKTDKDKKEWLAAASMYYLALERAQNK